MITIGHPPSSGALNMHNSIHVKAYCYSQPCTHHLLPNFQNMLIDIMSIFKFQLLLVICFKEGVLKIDKISACLENLLVYINLGEPQLLPENIKSLNAPHTSFNMYPSTGDNPRSEKKSLFYLTSSS